MKKSILIVIGIGVLLAVLGFTIGASDKDKNLSGFLTSTVTATNVSVTTATSSIISTGSGVQYLEITNIGTGKVHCAFGANSSMLKGMVLYPYSSTTGALNTRIITDANLLNKGMNCISDVVSTSSILKY